MQDDSRDEEKARSSSFMLLWCRMTFSSEPLWFRLVVILIMLSATVVIIYFMKEWALFAALGKRLKEGRLMDLIRTVRK